MKTRIEPRRRKDVGRRRGPMDDQEYGRDCVTQMLMLRRRPDILANALRDMGITENGDGIPEDEWNG